MSSAAFALPAISRPLHDPLNVLLDARVGWREGVFDYVEPAPIDGTLSLEPKTDNGSLLTDPGGTFGGLTVPPNVALGYGDSVYLLDQETALLKRFDPCSCLFETVPCTGGFGAQPRQLRNPGGIGIWGGNLYVCDAGNQRLQVFSLRGFALRSIWSSPGSAQLSQPWYPSGVVFDKRGRVFVSDPNNGCIHVFGCSGRWLTALGGLGAIKALTMDGDERLYILVDGEDSVRIIDSETGRLLQRITRPDSVASRFPKLPFPVTPGGHLVLGGLCTMPGTSLHPGGLSDAQGTPLAAGADTNVTAYQTSGTYLSSALDSELYRCQWDRLVLTTCLPKGCCIKVVTYTSETEQPLAFIQSLPETAWASRQVFSAQPAGNEILDWDCLIRSSPGRYLWLKLTLEGDGTNSPQIQQIQLQFPRISLRRYLPGVFGVEPVSADFSDRFLAVFDRTFRDIEGEIDNQARLFDPLSAPADSGRGDFLSWLASWIGITLERHWPLERRRRFLKNAAKLFAQRGTLPGLRRALHLYLGLEAYPHPCPPRPTCGPCTTTKPPEWQLPQMILEHFKLRRWLFLGPSRLGDQAHLWGQRIVNRSQLGGLQSDSSAQLDVSQIKTSQDPQRDPFHVYAHKFTVFAPAGCARSHAQKKALERLLANERPAHTAHQIVYVEPRMRIGIQSMIGFDTAIACYPEGVVLNGSLLGKATVLGSETSGGPTLQIGVKSRIGATTTLN